MQLSFTEKKNIRKSFGKLKESLSIPNLIEVQKNSYKELTHFNEEAGDLAKGFDRESVIPSLSGITEQTKSSRDKLEENEIFENEGSGVSIAGTDCSATLRTNAVYGNKFNGVLFLDEATGVAEDNDFYNNGNSAIDFSSTTVYLYTYMQI